MQIEKKINQKWNRNAVNKQLLHIMNEMTIHVSKDNQTQVELQFEDDTVWLSQKQMAQLFDKNIMIINEHLKNELSTIRKSLIVRKEGKREVKREIALYNLDAIMSVGYRVISKLVTQFRQWATERLKDHLVKGCTINQKRLRQSST